MRALPFSAAAMAGVMAAVAFAVGFATGLFAANQATDGVTAAAPAFGAHWPLARTPAIYENRPLVIDGPAGLERSAPTRLQIASIGVDSTLMELGLAADGTVEVPPTGFPAGWYEPSPTPGEAGTAVMLGHVDWAGPGVFYDLAAVQLGDAVAVTRADGSIAVFEVIALEEWPKELFPMDAVFGPGSRQLLALVTCGGAISPSTGHYEDNLLVWAELVETIPAAA